MGQGYITKTKDNKMKKQEQRIAIARHISSHARIPYLNMPDYCNDLNAIHEAEKVLTYNQQNYYEGTLCGVIRKERGINPHTCAARASFTTYATAAQRAEAFLKTLNLWT
ncbi:MAG: hypothetical protein DRH97_00780 [Chloroflexi bacterium]|nr:MAG: hypothetical protein DRH97_00780 [Chloroflexota bacterium]